MTQAKLWETVGTTGQYVNRLIKKEESIVNKTFVQMLEALGYELSVAKVTFGEEPKDYEVQEYIQKYYFSLKFSPAVETIVKDIKRNPKRMQREARKRQ